MAQLIDKEDSTTVLSEGGSDVQIVYVKRSVVRGYFDEEDVQFPFGEDFTAALDEAQGAASQHTNAVVILVIQDDEA